MKLNTKLCCLFASLILCPSGYSATTIPSSKGDDTGAALEQSQADEDAGLERGPKVLTNPVPTVKHDVQATEVMDTDPSTNESVSESPLPKMIERTVNPEKAQRFQVKKVERRKTLALALGGGGVRGAAHIGVLRVLEKEGIPIDYIVGNSMGAIIGGLYSAGVPLDEMESLACGGIFKRDYAPFMKMRAAMIPIKKLLPHFGHHSLAGIVAGTGFEKAIAQMIPEGQDDFSKTKVPFSAVATDLRDGKAYRISEGKLSTALRASSTISPLLKPTKIGDHIFVDGGIRANLPASSARDTGADVVLAVLVDEPLRELPEKAFSSYKGVASRIADIVLAVTDEHQLQFANIVLNPDVSGIPILDDKEENVEKAIRAGEAAARKALPEIRKQLHLENATLVESESGKLQ